MAPFRTTEILKNTKDEFMRNCKLAMRGDYNLSELFWRFYRVGLDILEQEKDSFSEFKEMYYVFLYAFHAYKYNTPVLKYIDYMINWVNDVPRWNSDIITVNFNIILKLPEVPIKIERHNILINRRIYGVKLFLILTKAGIKGTTRNFIIWKVWDYIDQFIKK